MYNVVDVNKIATAFLAKPPPQINSQSVYGLFLQLNCLANHWWTFWAEFQHCRQMKTKVMAANVSACSLFSVWLLYKSIFLLARLSSAITSKLIAWFSWNFKNSLFNTVQNTEKIKKKQKLCELCGFSLRGSHIIVTENTENILVKRMPLISIRESHNASILAMSNSFHNIVSEA